jgi:hypothetical protein
MEKGAIIALVFVVLGVLLMLVALYAFVYQKKKNRETQRIISDRDLLRMLHNEPDQHLSPHQLADKTELTVNEARGRLNALSSFGVLVRSSNSKSRHFFTPKDPVVEAPDLELSSDPFLTVEDLLKIFETYDYRVTAQQMIMATGLPLAVIKREMKYFESQDILQGLYRGDSNGMVTKRFYLLKDPYRSDPERFRAQAGKLDLEMREILLNDNLIV